MVISSAKALNRFRFYERWLLIFHIFGRSCPSRSRSAFFVVEQAADDAVIGTYVSPSDWRAKQSCKQSSRLKAQSRSLAR